MTNRKTYRHLKNGVLLSAGLLMATASWAGEQETKFDIPQTQLSDALMAFGVQCGYMIAFPEDLATGMKVSALQGSMEPQQALKILLKDTGLTYEVTGERMIRVIKAPQPVQKKIPLRSERSNLQRPRAEAPSYIDEVMVTATRRPTPMQMVPIAASAFGAGKLEAGRLEALVDITRLAPGITGSTFNQSSPIYAVRGASNTFSSAGASKPVGVFIDDVFIPRYSAADFDLFDLEQVTILRGPQGTLFGRNVTGGAIQLQTAKPSTEGFSGKVQASVGNLDYFKASALVNVPLSDTSAFKLSANYKTREGYIKDRFNGLDYNDIDTLSLRSQIMLQPSDVLELILSGDYTRDDNNSRGYSFVSNSAGTDTTGNDGDNRTAELNFPQYFDRDIFGVALTANWTLEAGTVSSISAYRYTEAGELYSLSPGAPSPLTATFAQQAYEDIEKPESFSQELRFVSEPGTLFDYVGGAYFYRSSTDRQRNQTRRGGLTQDLLFNTKADTTSYALYGDAVLHLLDGALDLSAGGRWTHEKNEIDLSTQDRLNPTRDFSASGSETYSKFTSRFVATWHASDDVTLYASRTEGFTAGGFNSEVDNPAIIDQVFSPETVTSYEVGLKSQAFNKQLTFNVAAFDEKFKDKQEGFFDPTKLIFSIFNAAEASTRGVELEATFNHESGLSATFTYAYLDTKYDTFVIPGGADYSGNKLSTSPENTFSAFLDYSTAVNDWGNLMMTVGYTHQGSYFTGASNSPDFLIDSYGLLNASIGFETFDERLKLTVWADNLTDEEYVLIRGTSFSKGEYFGAPRTYGLTLTYKY